MLASASFAVIMLLHKGLTHIHSQKKPRLHFGMSFNLSSFGLVTHSQARAHTHTHTHTLFKIQSTSTFNVGVEPKMV